MISYRRGPPHTGDGLPWCSHPGNVDYAPRHPGDMTLKLDGNAAVIRYRDNRFAVHSGGHVGHRGSTYYTNLYERGERTAADRLVAGVRHHQAMTPERRTDADHGVRIARPPHLLRGRTR